MTTIQALEQLGLSDKEAPVYAALLGMKTGTALTVAEAAGIKRPTAYSVLESLRKKKLVAITKFRSVRDYRAMPLDHLKHFIRDQKRTAEHFLPKIQKEYNERNFKVRLRIYHGLSDVKTLLEKSLREKARMDILGDGEHLKNTLGDYWLFYLKRAQQLGISPRCRSIQSPITLLLWSDKVAFVECEEEIQVFGLKNKELHDMYKTLFDKYQHSNLKQQVMRSNQR